ncbi:hypothetical protein LN050_02650 [Comamonadaceae bacterium M7527]|nr:hypothetical protein LN050_02650 [Comamonadaceae bacterium M7527]
MMILTSVKGFKPTSQPTRDVDIYPGLTAVVGDEGTGKTALLSAIAASHHDVCYLDHSWAHASQHTLDHTPNAIWAHHAVLYPRWQADLSQALASALDLDAHTNKPLHMLSTGSRRKVGLVCALSAGATITCIKKPFAALDLPSINVLLDVFQDGALSTQRAWVIADYVARPELDWRQTISL